MRIILAAGWRGTKRRGREMPSLGWGSLAEASGSKFERVKGQGGAPGHGDRRDRQRSFKDSSQVLAKAFG